MIHLMHYLDVTYVKRKKKNLVGINYHSLNKHFVQLLFNAQVLFCTIPYLSITGLQHSSNREKTSVNELHKSVCSTRLKKYSTITIVTITQ